MFLRKKKLEYKAHRWSKPKSSYNEVVEGSDAKIWEGDPNQRRFCRGSFRPSRGECEIS